MKTPDAEEHVKRLGRAHAKLAWLKRRANETRIAIEATEKSIADMEKHSAEAFDEVGADEIAMGRATP